MKVIITTISMIIFKICLIGLLYSFSYSAWARCYVVDPPCRVIRCYYNCYNPYPCYQPTYIYIKSTAPYRHNERDEYQQPEYEWVGDP